MTIPLIKKACNNLGLKYKKIDNSRVFLRVELGDGKFHLFITSNLGLNNEVTEKICRDKDYSHNLLSEYIRMPRSNSYLDSNPPELYLDFTKFNSHQEIVSDILQKHKFPLILKPNSKSMGVNVFSCNSEEEVVNAVDIIFNKNSFQYDHVLLVQEQIKIVKEFRVLVYNQEIQFAYQKDNSGENVKFKGNLSPLHFENAKAVLLDANDENKDQNDKIHNKKFLETLSNFIKPIFKHIELNYAGLDIAQDKNGKLYLLEINSKPGFTCFVRDNGAEQVINMFERILSDLLQFFNNISQTK